jgi:Tfp pilus assembly protein PilN
VKSVNLIPAKRRAAKDAARRMRMWIGGAAAYLVALLAVAVALRGPHRADASDLESRLLAVGDRIARTERDIAATRSLIVAEERLLTASKMVGDHPDWSLLLDLLASRRTSSIVLDSVDISPVAADGSSTITTALAVQPVDEAYMVKVSGTGLDQSAVTAFALALQESRVFARVDLVRTDTSGTGDAALTAFTLECRLAAMKQQVHEKERSR